MFKDDTFISKVWIKIIIFLGNIKDNYKAFRKILDMTDLSNFAS